MSRALCQSCFALVAVLRLLVCLSVHVACLAVEMQFIFTGSTRQKIAVGLRECDVFIIVTGNIETDLLKRRP